MNLTLKGFLRAYCRELTECQTDNLKTLFQATVERNPSAAEVLMSFASVQGKQYYLTQLSKGTFLYDDYCRVAEAVSKSGLEYYLASRNSPDRYQKVWYAYQAKKNEIEADRRIITLMRKRTLDNLSDCSITLYQICLKLNLNKGNVYAYLRKGDVTKVSLNTARIIMNYVISLTRANAKQSLL